MKLDMFITSYGKKLRCGYTTGSCATAATKAAAIMLKTQKKITSIELNTPAGVTLRLPISNIKLKDKYAECSVTKDGGDDPDTTTGIEIFSKVSKRTDGKIIIDGGEGIGRITRKGLFGNIGEAAINPIPKKMIYEELKKISTSGYDVLIYAPKGKETGKKTFNENIGIDGGISIIGTQGIVYPMSEEALKKTIFMEIDAICENYSNENILFVPGSHGKVISDQMNLDIPCVKVSNYIGESLLYAQSKGFKHFTIVGHIGKLSKLSLGIFNTHNKIADTRLEAFTYYLAMEGCSNKTIHTINSFLTGEEAFNWLVDCNLEKIILKMQNGCETRIKKYLKDKTIYIKVIMYSMQKGVIKC